MTVTSEQRGVQYLVQGAATYAVASLMPFIKAVPNASMLTCYLKNWDQSITVSCVAVRLLSAVDVLKEQEWEVLRTACVHELAKVIPDAEVRLADCMNMLIAGMQKKTRMDAVVGNWVLKDIGAHLSLRNRLRLRKIRTHSPMVGGPLIQEFIAGWL